MPPKLFSHFIRSMPGTWKALSFVFILKYWFVLLHKKKLFSLYPQRGGYYQYKSFFPCKWQAKGRASHRSEMTASVNLLPPLGNHSGMNWLGLARSKKPLHQQGKTSIPKSPLQSRDTKWRDRELPLPTPSRTILATFHFWNLFRRRDFTVSFPLTFAGISYWSFWKET